MTQYAHFAAARGMIFSVVCMYLFTSVLVMWNPDCTSDCENYDAVKNTTSTSENIGGRMNTAVTANATMLGVVCLFLFSKIFSFIGDGLLELVVGLVATSNTATEFNVI